MSIKVSQVYGLEEEAWKKYPCFSEGYMSDKIPTNVSMYISLKLKKNNSSNIHIKMPKIKDLVKKI